MQTLLKEHNQSLVVTCLLCLLALIFAACSSNSSGTQTTIKASNTTTNDIAAITSITNQTVLNSTKLDANPCPATVSTPSYWDPIVGTQPGVSAVQNVTCANLKGDSSLQALITVGYAGTSGVLDAYVYTNITASQPQEIFKLQGLAQGNASISANNTIITSEVDGNSTVSHEYAWSASAGQFVQIS
jgi:ABC-type enterochelin transport system substrate-binding protein